MDSIIMLNETWVYEFASELKSNSMTWKYPYSYTIK
jgi:hypothetical protein